MAFELTSSQIEAADRAMSTLTVTGCNKIIMLIVGLLALLWFAFVVYGCLADINQRKVDFGDVVATVTVGGLMLILTGIFIYTT